ncbi:Crp/Fnr family transcriptional regulator [Actinomycetaceae bacterium L2_0104]
MENKVGLSQRRRSPLTIPAADPAACTPELRVKMLARTSLFRDLEPGELDEVNTRCRAQGFGANEAIYHAGDPATRIYVVVQGAAKAVSHGDGGRETTLDICIPGDLMGAVPALGEQTYSESTWALIPSCTLSLDSEHFTEIINEFPSIAMATLKHVSRQLRDTRSTLHLLAGATLEQRLASTLHLLSTRLGQPWHGSTLISIPLSREDLAAMIGAAPESVSRLLSLWRKDGIIESGRRWIAVSNPETLTRLASTPSTGQNAVN